MYCLDTSVIIAVFDGKEEINKKLEKISSQEIFITPINLCELYKGAAHSQVTQKRLEFIERLLERVGILEFNEFCCRIFGEEYLKFKKIGKPIKDSDLMIAAITLGHNKTLITLDKKHFRDIKDLKLEVW